MPDVACPHCQRLLSTHPDDAGLEITCPFCKGRMIVPGQRRVFQGPQRQQPLPPPAPMQPVQQLPADPFGGAFDQVQAPHTHVFVQTSHKREPRLQAGGWFSRSFASASGVMLAVIGIPVVLMMVACGGCLMLAGQAARDIERSEQRSRSTRPSVSTPARSVPSSAASSSKLTLDNFNRVRMGMSENEVMAILGDDCEVMSENTIGAGTQFETNTRMIVWKKFLQTANVMFQNDKAMSKTQIGLK